MSNPTYYDLPQSLAGLSAATQHRIRLATNREITRLSKEQAEQEIIAENWRRWKAQHAELKEDIAYQVRKQKPPIGHKRGGTLLVQLSDLHFGALIRTDLRPGFDMRIAGKRLRKYAMTVLDYQLATGAEHLQIALTGDLVDSAWGKERNDKMLEKSCSQFLAMHWGSAIIRQFIDELIGSEQFASLSIAGVSGNEGRVTNEQGYGPTMAAANHDNTIHAQLSDAYGNGDVQIEFDTWRKVIQVEGLKFLLMHGHTFREKNPTQQNMMKYLREGRPEDIADFGISGHVHYPFTAGDWSRSGSLTGVDHYAENGLNLSTGRACQTMIHVQGKNRTVIQVDLEYAQDYEAYVLPTFNGAYGPEWQSYATEGDKG